MHEPGRPIGRQRQLEPFAERDDGGPVDVVVPLVQMRLDLESGRRAANLPSRDRPACGERLARPERRRAVPLRLPSVPVVVQLQRVEIELPPALVAQHVGGRPVLLLNPAELGEHDGQPLEVLQPHGKVEVVVRACLVSEQRVAPPATVDPPLDSGRVEPVEDLVDVGGGHGSTVTGLANRIAIVSYDFEWPRRFEAERALLADVLRPWLAGGIHHVGSTAIPGLAAKPIIDMIAGVGDFKEARAAYAPLQRHGYHHTPHRPGIAHHFSKPSPDPLDAQYSLHLTEPGSDLWLERLALRDTLVADPALAAEYQSLKLQLRERHPEDLAAYTTGKGEFVARVLELHGLEPGQR